MTDALQTAEDLLRFREPEKTAELVRGVLIVREPPGTQHGRCSNGSPTAGRAPDVGFVARERVAQITKAGYAALAPDSVVEILSPGISPR